MRALIGEDVCVSCGAPFAYTVNSVTRREGAERVAIIRCFQGHDNVVTTTVSVMGRGPLAVEAKRERDRARWHARAAS